MITDLTGCSLNSVGIKKIPNHVSVSSLLTEIVVEVINIYILKNFSSGWYVVDVEHPSQTIKAGGNLARQQCESASSAANMEESTFITTVRGQFHATVKQATSATHKRRVRNVRSHESYQPTNEAEEALK